MAYRSQPKRLARASSAALSCAAMMPLLIAGCQSNAQHDQVVRELRLQEDQLYAMEDYLTQYQQLLCKYRAENAELRRQLGADSAPAAPTPRTAPRTRNGAPPTINGPEIEIPRTPRTNGTRPQQELEVPDIPPLEGTTSADPDLNNRHRKVTLATGETTTPESTSATAIALKSKREQNVVGDVRLQGEVVENDAGGGPRLVVKVEPLDNSGRPTPFDGALSLMLIAPDGNGGQQSLARWDYGPKEVRAAAEAIIGEPAMQFHLELPPDIPVERTHELWVRLLPRRGGKLLTHADVNLQQPAAFTSLAQSPAPSDSLGERAVVAADYQDVTTEPRPIEFDVYDGGWTIARPGEPAGSPQGGDGSGDEWRASLVPPPAVVASSIPARPKPPVRRPSAASNEKEAAASNILRPSGRSPDRPANSSAETPRTAVAQPRWSATR